MPLLLRERLATSRAHGMEAIAEEANVDRAGLYRSFRGDMDPAFSTVFEGAYRTRRAVSGKAGLVRLRGPPVTKTSAIPAPLTGAAGRKAAAWSIRSRNPETKKDVVWFALDDDRPLFAFGGLWTEFKGDRGTKSKPIRGPHLAYLPDHGTRCGG